MGEALGGPTESLGTRLDLSLLFSLKLFPLSLSPSLHADLEYSPSLYSVGVTYTSVYSICITVMHVMHKVYFQA